MNALAPPAFSMSTPVAFLSPDRIPACVNDTTPACAPRLAAPPNRRIRQLKTPAGPMPAAHGTEYPFSACPSWDPWRPQSR